MRTSLKLLAAAAPLAFAISTGLATEARADPTAECNDGPDGDSTECGTDSSATGQNATAVGQETDASGDNSAAFGYQAISSGGNSVAIGSGAQSIGLESVAIGFGAQSTAANALAIGRSAQATRENSIAIGDIAQTTAANSVALGANSLADQEDTVSVGSAGSERRIVNVAPGVDPNDVVVMSQLSGMGSGLVAQEVASRIITVGAGTDGLLVDFTGTDGKRRLTGLLDGTAASDAATFGQLTSVSNLLDDTGQGAAAAFGGGAAFGAGGITNPSYSIQGDTFDNVGGALGVLDAQVTNNTDAIIDITNILGSGSVGLVQQAGPGADLTVGANTDGAQVNFAGTAGSRRLTGLASGNVSAASADAINGSQLFGTGLSIAEALGGGATVAADGTLTAPGYSLLGNTFGNVGDALGALGGQVSANTGRIGDIVDTLASIPPTAFISDDTRGGGAPVATGTEAAAGGRGAVASAARALALGNNAQASGVGSMAVGQGAVANAGGSIAIGDGAQATGALSISIGTLNRVSGAGSGAFGDPNLVSGDGSYAFGNDNRIEAGNAFVLGSNVSVASGLNGAVVLGSGSTAGAPVATPNVVINGITYSFAGGAPASAVSIGSAGAERMLTNLAAGRLNASSTDAVNGSQLFATNQAIEQLQTGVGDLNEQAVLYDDATRARVTFGGIGGTTLSNVAPGSVAATSTDAVTGAQLFGTALSIASALGGGAAVAADGTLAPPAYAVQGGSFDNVGGALGALDAQVTNNTNFIADLAGNVTDITNDITLGRIGLVQQASAGGDITVGGTAEGSRVTFAGTAGERQLAGVAAGAVSATSTDAVNGAQLDATNGRIDDLQDLVTGQAGGGFRSNNTSRLPPPQTPGVDASAGGNGAVASASRAVAVGNSARATTTQSTALGSGAEASGSNSVALGAGSTDGGAANVVSVGSAGSERRITNVAAGTSQTDVVNVSQLNASVNQALIGANNYTDSRIAELSFDMRDVRRDSEGGTAAAMALGGIPQSYAPGMGMVGIGVGIWQGESALAVGASKAAADGSVVLKVGATYTSRSQAGASAGVGFAF